jgi:hypothetical protein
MAAISAEICAHLARGILPLCADSVAAIRVEQIEQRREFLAELERLKELERAGRVLAAREERQAEAYEIEELETFRAMLASGGRQSEARSVPVCRPNADIWAKTHKPIDSPQASPI